MQFGRLVNSGPDPPLALSPVSWHRDQRWRSCVASQLTDLCQRRSAHPLRPVRDLRRPTRSRTLSVRRRRASDVMRCPHRLLIATSTLSPSLIPRSLGPPLISSACRFGHRSSVRMPPAIFQDSMRFVALPPRTYSDANRAVLASGNGTAAP